MIFNIFRALADVVVCQGDAHSYSESNFGVSTPTRAQACYRARGIGNHLHGSKCLSIRQSLGSNACRGMLEHPHRTLGI